MYNFNNIENKVKMIYIPVSVSYPGGVIRKSIVMLYSNMVVLIATLFYMSFHYYPLLYTIV